MSITDYRAAQREDRKVADAARLERERLAEETRLQREQQQRQERLDLKRLELEAKEKEREQARLDREQKAREQREREERERQANAAAAKERARQKRAAAKERRERRQAALKRMPAWIAEHLDLAAALVVMGCSIVPALISQASMLGETGLNPLMVGMLPVMLECAAWAATAGEAKAVQQVDPPRSPWPYRIAIYVFAGLASAINFTHGQDIGGQEHGTQLGVVLAASSIVPIALWQLVQAGRHQESAKLRRAVRQARRDERETRKQRQSEFPRVWAVALQLRAIAGYAALSPEDAWLAAWAVREAAGVDLPEDLLRLLSADLLGLRADAESRIAIATEEFGEGRVLRLKASSEAAWKRAVDGPEGAADGSVKDSANGSTTPSTNGVERSVVSLVKRLDGPLIRQDVSSQSSQITPSIPPSARTSKTAHPRTRDTRTKQSPQPPSRTSTTGTNGSKKRAVRSLSPGARNAAAETARRFSAEENQAIESWIAEQLQNGSTVTWGDVKEETHERRVKAYGPRKAAVPSRAWCYSRIGAVKRATGRAA
jgi:Skp family chaperone for outer membrane proteins